MKLATRLIDSIRLEVEVTLLMAQWVEMEAENHALSACRCVTTLFEADSRLLISVEPHQESKRHERDALFLFSNTMSTH